MAEQFIGLTVLVTLKHPPHAKLRGRVTDVIEQRLILQEVTWLPEGTFLDQYAVSGNEILDLEIESQTIPKPVVNETRIDPAIVSFTRSPARPHSSSISQLSGPNLSAHESEPHRVSPLPRSHESNIIVEPLKASQTWPPGVLSRPFSLNTDTNLEHALASATLTEPFNDSISPAHSVDDKGRKRGTKALQISKEVQAELNIQASQEISKSKGRRNRGRRGITRGANQAEEAKNVSIRSEPGSPLKEKSLGWRQTPLTESYPSPAPHFVQPDRELDAQSSLPEAPAPGNKRRSRARQRNKARRNEQDDQNGWATEEVTDIQDMGDFDFEGNLSKFDKRKIFEQIREEDTTADEDRLVSFNRTHARPRTHGGKNLHFTENVLDSSTKNFVTSSSESDNDMHEAMMNSSRSSHRNPSRTSSRKIPSRKGSAIANGADSHTIGSSSTQNLSDKKLHGSHVSPNNFSGRATKSNTHKQNRVLRTTGSQRDCPCLSPLQMMELEQLVVSRMGVTEDMIAESAALAIAQTARKLSSSQGDPNLSERNQVFRPFIVILTGNHKTGSRAIAAARQLRNHSAQVLLCILGLQRESDLLDDVRRQLTIFRNGGGKTIRQDQLVQGLAGTSTSLIVDAILGIHMSFLDLRHDDQANYLQLLRWSNSMNALTLSIDIPSGVDASTGEPSTHGSTNLVIRTDHVLSLGAPKNGLLLGMDKVSSFKNHLSWLVADIGIGNAAWKKSGLRRTKGVDFGAEWVVELEFVDSVGASAGPTVG